MFSFNNGMEMSWEGHVTDRFEFVVGIDLSDTETTRTTIFFLYTGPQQHLFSSYTLVRNIYHSHGFRIAQVNADNNSCSFGFRIAQVNADNEFEPIRNMVLPAHLHTVAKGKYVPEVERSIRTTKEDTRAGLHGVPFERFPNSMTRGLLLCTIINRNGFPSESGISQEFTHRNIIDNRPNLDCNVNLKYPFAHYGQLPLDNEFTNGTRTRTIGALAL